MIFKIGHEYLVRCDTAEEADTIRTRVDELITGNLAAVAVDDEHGAEITSELAGTDPESVKAADDYWPQA